MPDNDRNNRPPFEGGPEDASDGRPDWMKQQVGGVGRRRGRPVFVQPGEAIIMEENGDASVKIQAHPGDKVEVAVGNDFKDAVTFEMTDEKGDGTFSAVISHEGFKGPQNLSFRVNDTPKINLMGQMVYHANSLANYAEFPDPETDDLIAARPDIEHGMVSHAFLWSQTYGRMMPILVYTPPKYPADGPYPVLYFVHECAENELAWTPASRTNYLFDNMITDRKCSPFIEVEVDCTMSLGYHDKPDMLEGFPELEQFVIKECAPYVESHFNVKADKADRAMAGIGLGAAQAGYIGLRNTDFFDGIGIFTAFWVTDEFHEHGKEDPIYDAVEKLGKNPDSVKVLYRAEGDKDMHYKLMGKENELITELGVEDIPGYRFETHHDVDHSWGSYRRSLRDFLPMIFPDAGQKG